MFLRLRLMPFDFRELLPLLIRPTLTKVTSICNITNLPPASIAGGVRVPFDS